MARRQAWVACLVSYGSGLQAVSAKISLQPKKTSSLFFKMDPLLNEIQINGSDPTELLHGVDVPSV